MRMILCAILTLAASGCADDGWEEDPWDGIWIDYPDEAISTDKATAWVSGRVSEPAVSVSWTCGAQSGGAVVTTSREGGGWPFYGWVTYTHSWSFQVNLSLGDNTVAVTGWNSDGRQGTVSVVIRRVEVSTPPPALFNKDLGFNGSVRSIAPAADGTGDIYVGGQFTAYNGTGSNRIVRLNSDGNVDAAFTVGSGFDGAVESIAPAADSSGDIYVGGQFSAYNGRASNRIVRLNPNGSVDAAFAVGSGFDYGVWSIAPTADGSGNIYVGGGFTSYNGTALNRVVRLNSDGSVDDAFAVGSGFDSFVFSIAPAADGSGDIYVGGGFTSYNGSAINRIVRLNSDGSVDAAFAVGSGFDSNVLSIAPAADGTGDIYVGGQFTAYNGTGSNRIIRLNPNGSVDATFAVGSGFNSAVESIAPAADGSGSIYVGGWFTSYYVTAINRIVRLNSDGSVDAAFAVGSGFDSQVWCIAPAADGRGDIYVGGGFLVYQSVAVDRIARLNRNGTAE